MSHPQRLYKKARAHNQDPAAIMAQIFEKCAIYAERLENALSRRAYAEAAKSTDTLITTLTAIMGSLNQNNTAPSAVETRTFCTLALDLIIEINQHEDLKKCKNLKLLFKNMSSLWTF